MSILDWTDDEALDLQSMRIELNQKANNNMSDLYKYIYNRTNSSHATINTEGVMEFQHNATITGKEAIDVLMKHFDDGVITGLRGGMVIVESSMEGGRQLTNFPKIEAECLTIRSFNEISGLKAHIIKSPRGNKGNTCTIDSERNQTVRIKDCSIDFQAQGHITIFCEKGKIYEGFWNGLTSNCYNINLFVSDIDGLDSILEFGEIKVYDNTKKEEVVMNVKDFKKARAIANNNKRYKMIDHIVKFKEGAKMSDWVPLSQLTNLNEVCIISGDVQFTFVKIGAHEDRIYAMSRIPKPKNYTLDEMYPKTEDGWRLIITKL